MATYEGSNGAVKVVSGTGTSTAIANVRSWTVTHTRDTVEDTAMGDGFRTHKKGLQSWSGSMEIIFDDSSNAEVSAALDPNTDDTVTVELFPDAAVTATKFSGAIIVTSYAITASYDGLVTASVAFSGTGALTAGAGYGV